MGNIKESMSALLSVDGASAAAIVDSESGMVLGKEGTSVDLDIAGAGNTEVVRAKLKTMKALKLTKESIEDMLITLSSQYHIITPLPERPAVFTYLVVEKDKGNLALARIKAKDVATQLDF